MLEHRTFPQSSLLHAPQNTSSSNKLTILFGQVFWFSKWAQLGGYEQMPTCLEDKIVQYPFLLLECSGFATSCWMGSFGGNRQTIMLRANLSILALMTTKISSQIQWHILFNYLALVSTLPPFLCFITYLIWNGSLPMPIILLTTPKGTSFWLSFLI